MIKKALLIYRENRNMSLLLLAIIISRIGDTWFTFFVGWTVYSDNNNIQPLVAIIGSSYVFRAILSLFSGFIVDMSNRKKIMIFSNILSSAVVFMFLILYHQSISYGYYIGIVILINIFNEFFSKSFLSYTADIMEKETYIKFSSARFSVNRAISLMGNVIMGFAITFISSKFIIATNAISFLICAYLIKKVKVEKNYDIIQNTSEKKQINIDLKKIGSFIKVHLLNKPTLLTFCLLIMILNLDYAYIPKIFPYFITGLQNNSSAFLVGLIKSSVSFGDIIGSLAVIKIGHKVTTCFRLGLIGSMISIALLFLFSQVYIVVLLSFLFYGFFDSLTQPLFSYIVSGISSEIRGRVMGIMDMLLLIVAPFGMWLGGFFNELGLLATCIYLIIVFFIGLLIQSSSKNLQHIDLGEESNNVQQNV